MKHRSKVEIIADMLETIMADSSMSSSKIMYKAFLSYKQLKEYVPLLLQNELIKHGEKDRTFTITDKGVYYLEMYNNLPEFVGIAR
ncbi:MAG: winged helix-turn-helix domain-containing protein [Nitrososphaeraceae archaeon]